MIDYDDRLKQLGKMGMSKVMDDPKAFQMLRDWLRRSWADSLNAKLTMIPGLYHPNYNAVTADRRKQKGPRTHWSQVPR